MSLDNLTPKFRAPDNWYNDTPANFNRAALRYEVRRARQMEFEAPTHAPVQEAFRNDPKGLREHIAGKCAAYFDISKHEMFSDCQIDPYVNARQAFCALAFELTHETYASLGRFLNRHHSTIIHAVEIAKTKPDVAQAVAKIRAQLNSSNGAEQ